MPSNQQTQADQVWSLFDQETRQEVIDEFRRVVKEMIDEHFRISSSLAILNRHADDLRATVESEPSGYQQGEPANAIRAA